MDEGARGAGLVLNVDPRWIVAVPGNDVEAETRRQLGDCPEGESADRWEALIESTSSMLRFALDAGVSWTGAFLGREADGTVNFTRAVIEIRPTDGLDITADMVYDQLVEEHRDAAFAATIDHVRTRLGAAVRHQQVVDLGDGVLGELASYLIPRRADLVAMQAFSTGVGWAKVWGPMLEAMVLSLAADDASATGRVRMVSYEATGVG